MWLGGVFHHAETLTGINVTNHQYKIQKWCANAKIAEEKRDVRRHTETTTTTNKNKT